VMLAAPDEPAPRDPASGRASLGGRTLARLDGWLGRRAGAVLAVGLLVIAAGAALLAAHVGRQARAPTRFALQAPGRGLTFEVDCGGPEDHPWDGRAGHLGGAASRQRLEAVPEPPPAPREALATVRTGEAFAYRLRTGRGWFELELIFVDGEERQPGASRQVDLDAEGAPLARGLDLHEGAYPGAPQVRRWAVWVEDGTLDLTLRGRGRPAVLSYLRVRRLDLPTGWRSLPGDP